MSKGFWDTLPRPFFALAPMADVTDPAFRRVIAKCGKPSVMWTEFVSADGLARAPEEGRKKLVADLQYSEPERPIVAQFFTGTPWHMEQAAALAAELGFDGVDINMGCPDKSIEKQKAGAALMKDLERAREIIAAAKQGAKGLPVSVKTRLGYNKDELETLLPSLLSTGLAAIIIHARTRKEMSKVPAHWDRVKRAVEIRNELKSETLIVGNGDVVDLVDAERRAEETGADGIMLGRAIFGNPFLFSGAERREESPGGGGQNPPMDFGVKDFSSDVRRRLTIMVEHSKLFEELLPHKSFAIMKKHYKAYATGFDGAAELRAELFATNSAAEVEIAVDNFLATHA